MIGNNRNIYVILAILEPNCFGIAKKMFILWNIKEDAMHEDWTPVLWKINKKDKI